MPARVGVREMARGEALGELGAGLGPPAEVDQQIGHPRERAHDHDWVVRQALGHQAYGDPEVLGDAHRSAAELHDDHEMLRRQR